MRELLRKKAKRAPHCAADRAKSTEQGSCCPQSAAKKRSHLVIGESALLIADYFDRVGFLKISR
jgi:hypothetical protein